MMKMTGVLVCGALAAGVLLLAPSLGRAQAGSPDNAAAAPIHRENIEWLDVWIPDSNATALPRVLLIGDSITKEYGPLVEKNLKGKAYVARLTTSKSLGDPVLLQEVALVLSEIHFDVVHFNNGMHGHDYTEEQYAAAFPELIATIKKGAPGAKLICATTTPTREAGHLDQVGDYTQRVIARNTIAAEVCGKDHIPLDDLFSVINNHPEYYKPDGVHHIAPGVNAEAKQVTAAISALLK